MSEGWIKLYRKIQDCPFWHDEMFSRGQAWVDLLLLANHKENKILVNGNIFTVQRGQIFTSIRKLSERWKWSYDKVSRYLKLLEQEGMLQKESNKTRTLLTIEKYEVYQDVPNTNRTPTSEQSEHQQVNSPNTERTPISDKQECKEVKNDKNVKKVNSAFKLPKVVFPEDEKMNEAFIEFAEMRKRIKKPISTEKTFKRLLSTLEKLSNGDNNLAIEILNQSTDCCYQGLFEIKQDHRGNRNSNNEVTMKDWMNRWGLESDGE